MRIDALLRPQLGSNFNPCVGWEGAFALGLRALMTTGKYKRCVGGALGRMALSSSEYLVLKKKKTHKKTCVSVDVLTSEASFLIGEVKK